MAHVIKKNVLCVACFGNIKQYLSQETGSVQLVFLLTEREYQLQDVCFYIPASDQNQNFILTGIYWDPQHG